MKEIIKVKGMHCRSCEVLVEEKVSQIEGVNKVHANSKKNEVFVNYDENIRKPEVVSAIREAGYEVGSEDLPFITDNKQEFLYLFTATFLFIFLILLGNSLGLSRIFTYNSQAEGGFLVALGVGAAAGFSSCMALVGGIILGVSVRFSEKHPNSTVFEKFRPHLFFNLGRIISYFILGGLIGELGSILKFSGSVLGFITLAVAIFMLILGIQLIEIFPRFSNALVLPKFISNTLKLNDRKRKEYSHLNAIILGGLTFFLPCGFTQAMQVLAISSGSFVKGALIMSLFAIGTAPGLLTVGGLTAVIKKGNFAKFFFKFIGVALIALAVFNFSNALNLTGLKSYIISVNSGSADIPPAPSDKQSVVLENGVQTITMTQDQSGYKPNHFTIKKGIPVVWKIESKSISTCASSVVIPKLGVEKIFKLGQNEIDFTPTEVGRLNFTCAMGMYNGYFNVIE